MTLLGSIESTAFVTGHRPKDLPHKCYSKTDRYFSELVALSFAMQEYLYTRNGVYLFEYGGAQGWDTISFYAGLELREKYQDIKLILVVPFEDQPLAWLPKPVSARFAELDHEHLGMATWQWCKQWAIDHQSIFGAESILMYSEMVEQANEVIYVDTEDGYWLNGVGIGKYHPKKLQLRNEFMVDHGRYGLGLFQGEYVSGKFNGKAGGTKNCLDYAEGLGRNFLNYDPVTSKLDKIRVD